MIRVSDSACDDSRHEQLLQTGKEVARRRGTVRIHQISSVLFQDTLYCDSVFDFPSPCLFFNAASGPLAYHLTFCHSA